MPLHPANDEGDIENIMNDSDAEFVAEDESVISTKIIRKEEMGDQSSTVSVSIQISASIQIFSTQNEDETNNLGLDELNFEILLPLPQHTSNQSPSPANQRTTNQSFAAATHCTADQSPAAVVTRCTSNQSSKSTPPPTVTIPKNTKKRKQSSMIKDKTKRKRSILYPTRTIQTRKRAMSRKTKTKQRRKSQYDRGMEMGG